jgi:Domain of unknown function (DUF5134)
MNAGPPPPSTIPGWILGIFAAIMLMVAAVSAARLLAARPWRGAGAHVDIDAAHLLMGIAMAGLLTASLRTLPDGTWEMIFGALTGWFAWRVYQEARRSRASVPASVHHVPDLVNGAAMFFMYLAVAASPAAGSPGTVMQTLRQPTLALVFALLLVGCAVRDLDLLSGPAAGGRYTLTGTGIAAAGPVLAAASALASAPAGPTPSEAAEGGQATAPRPGPAEPEAAARASGDAAVGGSGVSRRLTLAPGLGTGCRIAIGVTIAFMLIITI